MALQGFGAEIKDFYLTLGEYDAVVVLEAPDDETVAKASLTIGALGNVRIETLRAFTEDEYRRMIGTPRCVYTEMQAEWRPADYFPARACVTPLVATRAGAE